MSAFGFAQGVLRARLPGWIVIAASNGVLLNCRVAVGFLDRLRGLLGTKPGSYLEKGILLTNCASIHTNGMSYPIDVAFIDKNPYVVQGVFSAEGVECTTARVLAVYRHVMPGNVVSCPGARATIERESRPDSPWMQVGSRVICRYRASEAAEAPACPCGPADSSSTQISEHNTVQVR